MNLTLTVVSTSCATKSRMSVCMQLPSLVQRRIKIRFLLCTPPRTSFISLYLIFWPYHKQHCWCTLRKYGGYRIFSRTNPIKTQPPPHFPLARSLLFVGLQGFCIIKSSILQRRYISFLVFLISVVMSHIFFMSSVEAFPDPGPYSKL